MSVNFADLYGKASNTVSTFAATTVGGPNQGAVAPVAGAAGTGPTTNSSTAGTPAVAWLGLFLLLVAWRVLVEMGARG